MRRFLMLFALLGVFSIGCSPAAPKPAADEGSSTPAAEGSYPGSDTTSEMPMTEEPAADEGETEAPAEEGK